MNKRKIYVASSWRNEWQQTIVKLLMDLGHEVYDFKNPPSGTGGFSWSSIDPMWYDWTTKQYRDALQHPISDIGFNDDFGGMTWADCCVLVMPCGRSAHTEAGFMKGTGKNVYVLHLELAEPELMYRIYDGIIDGCEELIELFTINP